MQKSQEEKLKKKNSYTYWVDEKNKSKELPENQRPQKVEHPQEIKIQHNGKSVWNHSGTWEEKKIALEPIQAKMQAKIADWLGNLQDPPLKLKEVSLNGECQKIFRRNKASIMYELKGKVNFAGKAEDGNCQFQYVEFTDHGDRCYQVKCTEKNENAFLKEHSQFLLDLLQQQLQRCSE